MSLLTAGYWHTTYWSENYWFQDYWPEYVAAVAALYTMELLFETKVLIEAIFETKTITEMTFEA